MTAPEATAPKRFIQRIQVDGLLGQFDHDLRFADANPDAPNLLILYGENGTGKTTLLWLVYHLLNKEGRRGHRTYLATHQFKRIAVTFGDGTEISAERLKGDKGSFVLKAVLGPTDSVSFKYEVNENGRIPTSVSDEPVHMEFSGRLPTFNFGFLPHDRSTKIDIENRRFTRARYRTQIGGQELISPIRASIAGAITAARQQAIRASNAGQLSVNSIYTELVRQIAQVPLMLPEGGIEEGRVRLLGRLKDQARITSEYSKLGLTSELQIEGLLETLETMPPGKFSIVDKVLEPFFLGNEARLQALHILYIALTTTVESINSMYLNKHIVLHLEKGLSVLTQDGAFLLPEQLSSGEQELLILFCEVITALRPDTILFIDEPELSLNVSWQRQLLGSLLRCASGYPVQFVIATHAIEILAHYRANVTRLSNKVIAPTRPAPITEQIVG